MALKRKQLELQIKVEKHKQRKFKILVVKTTKGKHIYSRLKVSKYKIKSENYQCLQITITTTFELILELYFKDRREIPSSK